MGRKSSINKIKRSNAISKDIESSLVMNLYEKGHSPISTHFTGYGIGEADVISVSKSDFIYEYEVKISRSDFQADFKKDKHKAMSERKSVEFINESITDGRDVWYLNPNYFYFVVPENLISIDEVPEYAGLIYVKEQQIGKTEDKKVLVFDIIKKPPMLHNIKATRGFIRQLSHNLTCKLVFKKIS